MFKAMPKL